ncbi:cyclic nucleotide-binding domain containing protein, putative [Babesia bigemina]|uniref:Cyclic nucleotide-binding domain containing protein, putative n=1 Tax=Babesia bigemina TaxID=5866 RepID=A0A061D8U3_BABBI|nr:cyclic nucleotide-binding domain containing protein, putative [Babesia bigemina]CDR94165.1 cyclic nucleotide-binding domain containing protein, putative [Babesia bigemina]|eukprot:XP_012766351.1 cyclic nucleotide-binding domain containing protein, putative [Babesia bigemina]
MSLTGKCACVEKLSQLHATVLSDLHPCKEQVYEARVSQLQSTIDTLQLRNADLCTQLADIRSRIAADPFLSSKFQCVTEKSSEEPSRIYGVNLDPTSSPADVYRQLCVLADRNRDLESRLFTEQAISMSWKHKINSLEQRLKEQLDDLVYITRDVTCMKDVDCAGKRSDRREALTKEALELLKLARLRIDGDRTRMEMYANRIADLERELLEHRLKASDAASQLDHSSAAAAISQRQADITGGRPASTYPLRHAAQPDSCVAFGTSALMRELEMSKGSLRHGVWNNVDGGCNVELSQSELLSHSASASQEDDRRKLIRLYSDILTLIRKNNVQAIPPVTQMRSMLRTGSQVDRNSESGTGETPINNFPIPPHKVDEDRIDKAVAKNHDYHITPGDLACMPSVSVVKREDDASRTVRAQPSAASNTDESAFSLEERLISTSKTLPRNESENSDPADDSRQGDTLLLSSESATETQSARFTDVNTQMDDSPSSDDTVMLSSSSMDNGSPVSSDTCDGSHHDGSAPDDVSMAIGVTNCESNQSVKIPDDISEDLASSSARLGSSDTSISNPRADGEVKSSHLGSRLSSVEHVADKFDHPSPAVEVTSKICTMTPEPVNGTASVSGTPRSSSASSLHDNTKPAESGVLAGSDSPLESRFSDSPSSLGKGSPDVSSQILRGHESKSVEFNGIDIPLSELPSYEFGTACENSMEDQTMRRGDTLSVNGLKSFVSAQKREMLDALLLLLQGVPVLNELSEERLRGLLPYFKLQSYSPRAAIILAGEQPRCFYILASGMVSAYSYESFDKPNRLLRRYLNADYFGELSLINNRTCTSYIIAEGHVTVHAMEGQDFVEQLSDLFPKFMERAMAEYDKSNWRSTVSPSPRVNRKAVEDLPDITTFISNVPIISTASHMDSFISSFAYRKFGAKEVIATSLTSLPYLYVVYRGSVAVQLRESESAEVSEFAVLDPMSFIGGVCFVDPHVQWLSSASLVATSETILLFVEADTLEMQPENWKTHVRTYQEQFFVDKMVERKLLQGVEKLSAPPKEITHSGSLSDALISSDSGGFSDGLNENSSITSDRSPQSLHAMGDMSPGQASSSAVSTVKEEDECSDLMDSVLPSPKSSVTSDDLSSVSSQMLEDTSAVVRTGSYKLLNIQRSPVNDVKSGVTPGTTTALIKGVEKKASNFTAYTPPTGHETSISSPVKDISRDIDKNPIAEDDCRSLISESDQFRESDRSESLASDCMVSDRNVDNKLNTEDNTDERDVDANATPRSFARKMKRAPTGIFKNDRKTAQQTLNKAPRGTVGSTTELPATYRSSVGDTELRDSSIDSMIDETDGLSDDTSFDSDLSDLPSSSFSDCSSVTPKNYDENTVNASKDLLIATLKCKCTSLGAAFTFMDANNCGVVFRQRFYDAIEELGIASIESSELPYLFDLLRENDREVMTVASLYRNSGERVSTAQEFCTRLKHVHGSSRVAFEKHFGPLKMSSTCAEADFLILAMNVGVEEDDARKIFKTLDICGNSYVTILTMLKLMRGDWTLDVALEKEQAAVSSYNQIVGYWQNDDYESFRKEFSNPYICVFDILEYGVDVSQVDCGWEEVTSLAIDSSTKSHYVDTLIIPTLETHSYFRQLSPIQIRFVASLFVESRSKTGTVIFSQGDDDFPLYIVLSGQVHSTYITYLYTESTSTDVIVGSLLEFDCFISGQQSPCTYKVGSIGPAVLASIAKAMFREAVQPIIDVRSKRVPVISTFLSKVPCLEGLDPEVIDRIACASVVRKRKNHETIIREGDSTEWMYIIFDGSVDIKVSSAANQIADSVTSTGLLGAEEVAFSLPSYVSTAIANSSTVLLIGWLASSFATAFGDAAERIREASREASLVRSNSLKTPDQQSQRLLSKSTKTVSFSINRTKNA